MTIRADGLERLSPRLRVICNGDAEVNGVRAQLSAAVEAEPTLATRLGAHRMLQHEVSRAADAGPLDQPPPQDVPRHTRIGELEATPRAPRAQPTDPPHPPVAWPHLRRERAEGRLGARLPTRRSHR